MSPQSVGANIRSGSDFSWRCRICSRSTYIYTFRWRPLMDLPRTPQQRFISPIQDEILSCWKISHFSIFRRRCFADLQGAGKKLHTSWWNCAEPLARLGNNSHSHYTPLTFGNEKFAHKLRLLQTRSLSGGSSEISKKFLSSLYYPPHHRQQWNLITNNKEQQEPIQPPLHLRASTSNQNYTPSRFIKISAPKQTFLPNLHPAIVIILPGWEKE